LCPQDQSQPGEEQFWREYWDALVAFNVLRLGCATAALRGAAFMPLQRAMAQSS